MFLAQAREFLLHDHLVIRLFALAIQPGVNAINQTVAPRLHLGRFRFRLRFFTPRQVFLVGRIFAGHGIVRRIFRPQSLVQLLHEPIDRRAVGLPLVLFFLLRHFPRRVADDF